MATFNFLTEPFPLTKLSIDGKRVRLLSLTPKYTQEIFNEFTPEVTRYMMPRSPTKIFQTEQFVSGSLKKMNQGEELILVNTLKTTGEFLGLCGLHLRSDGAEKPELGIWLKKSAHGQGYGREAIELLVSWAKRNFALNGFIYPVDRANISSRRIPERLGGIIVEEKKTKNESGVLLDEVVYYIQADCIE